MIADINSSVSANFQGKEDACAKTTGAPNPKKTRLESSGNVSPSMPSGKVLNPICIWDRKTKIHFNKDLIPGSSHAINPDCKEYTPEINNNLFSEVDKAMHQGITFTAILVDVSEKPYVENILKLVEFCNSRSIPILNYEFEHHAAKGDRTPRRLKNIFTKNTTSIMKQTHSIFSTPETHLQLSKLKPDALIMAGEMDNCCIRASMYGVKEGTNYFDDYGEEYGAVEYGYRVYSQSELIDYETWHLKAEKLFMFDRLRSLKST